MDSLEDKQEKQKREAGKQDNRDDEEPTRQ